MNPFNACFGNKITKKANDSRNMVISDPIPNSVKHTTHIGFVGNKLVIEGIPSTEFCEFLVEAGVSMQTVSFN